MFFMESPESADLMSWTANDATLRALSRWLDDHSAPCPGSGTALPGDRRSWPPGSVDITGANPYIAEIPRGSHIIRDASHGNLVSGFEVALIVLFVEEDTIIDSGRFSAAAAPRPLHLSSARIPADATSTPNKEEQ
jgi:hypothetical protein